MENDFDDLSGFIIKGGFLLINDEYYNISYIKRVYLDIDKKDHKSCAVVMDFDDSKGIVVRVTCNEDDAVDYMNDMLLLIDITNSKKQIQKKQRDDKFLN